MVQAQPLTESAEAIRFCDRNHRGNYGRGFDSGGIELF